MQTSKGLFSQFISTQSGNAALLFGLAATPMVVAGGVAIDYSTSSNTLSAYQAASDAAALAGAKLRVVSQDAARREANTVFLANLTSLKINEAPVPRIEFIGTTGVRVSGTGEVRNRFMSGFGVKASSVSFKSEAEMAAPNEVTGVASDEIALVLDNTGSMVNDMVALRAAASSFVEKTMGGTTKVSVVPFVTAVNVGTRNLTNSHLDRLSQSKWHGIFTRNPTDTQSVQNFNGGRASGVAQGGCNYSSGGGGSGGPGKGGKGAWFAPSQWNADEALKTIFGINTAHAQAAVSTPNTIPPLKGRTFPTGSAARVPGTLFLPDGFRISYFECHLEPPTKINHFDLLDRMPGARWKGCVEARPEPFDATDDAPSSSNPDSLFVPYFWPDEHDPDTAETWMPKAQNNYMRDVNLPAGWEHRDRTANLFKYDGKNPANVVETAPDTLGPNKACPSEMQRLTSDKSAVNNAIGNMRHWNGGGTVLVEGLAWGWRSLSPNAPLADGKPYSKDTKKTIVFMSDGENELGDSGTDYYSHYSSYGFLASGRFPKSTFQEAHKYLDDRFLQACSNAKAKGIRIVTILFRSSETRGVDLMKRCATSPSDSYVATTQSSLAATFDKIAGQFEGTNKKLRLVR